MLYLIAVSTLWAFSFGLMGNRLAGLDPVFVAAVRIGLAAIVFAPLLRPRTVPPRDLLKLTTCGAVQFGVMYLAYTSAFRFIPSHLVALFSIFTPLYVVFFCDLGRRRFHPAYLGVAALSVCGAAIIKAGGEASGSVWKGFVLMQVAGVAFAGGQVWYRGLRRGHPGCPDRELMGWLYIGAFAVASGASALLGSWQGADPEPGQWVVLLYLGVVASGMGFFLWNKGAALAKPATLAACNNAVIPLAMLVSLLFFGEAADLSESQMLRLAAGALLIGASVFLGERLGAEIAQTERKRV